MSTQIGIPGYLAGTWAIDAARSEVSFQIRHFGLFTVRGTFDEFEGTVITAEDPLGSRVNAVVKAASVNTGNKRRDRDVHKRDYLHVAEYPAMTFSSTRVRIDGGGYLVDGDLTIRAVTKSVTLRLEPAGFGGQSEPVVMFTARTEISCDDFGVTRGPFRAIVGDKVGITLRVQANKQD